MKPERKRLPDRRGSERFAIEHAGLQYLVTISRFGDGRLGEIFIDSEKPNSAVAVHANDAAVLASMLLQHGVSASDIQHSVSGPIAVALAKAEGGT
jgi:hypothetical protein